MQKEGTFAMYKGFWSMIFRDVPGWAAYFWLNQYLKDHLGVTEAEQQGTHWSGLNLAKRLLIGGLAGCANWGIGYPYDVIKTRVQCTADYNLKIRDAFREGYRKGGIRYFYNGFLPTMQRAFVANLVCLPIFDYLDEFYIPRSNDD